MRIEGPSRSGPAATRGGARNAGAGGAVFQPAGAATAQRATNVASSAPATGIEALLALQSVDDPLLCRRKKIKRGHSILDVLDELKVDLLSGNIGEGRLNRLLALIQQARSEVDPDLDNLLQDIELRALVELAKRGRYIEP